MQREQVRQVISQTVQQSLSESGVAISAIPATQLQALVNALGDGVFAALSALEEDGDQSTTTARSGAMPANAAAPDLTPSAEEKLLWRGRPYLTIGVIYELTNQRLRILRGLLGNQIEELELIRVRDTKLKQHLGERILDVGDVTIISGDASTPEIVLNNVRNPLEVRELLRKAVQVEKQRRGLVYREVIHDENSH